MTKHENAAGDPSERLSPELYRELGKNGWRLPQTEHEVRAAEEWVSKTPDRLPEGLHDLPGKDHSPEPGPLLDRYLNTDRVDRSADDAKAKDDDRLNRDLDRD